MNPAPTALTKAETRSHYEKLAEEAASYRPPLEQICPTCGGKRVGRCSLNACFDPDIGRAWEWPL